MNSHSRFVPLYAAIDGRARRLSDEEVVFYDPALDRNHVMTTQVLSALDACRTFQPIEVHVAAVIAAQPDLRGKEQAVARVVEGLAGRGLLITDDAFLHRLASAGAVQPAPYAGHVMLGDGAGAICADTLRILDASGVVEAYYIESAAGAAPTALRERASSGACRITIITETLRGQIIDALVEALPEQGVALRALLSKGESGARNLATLLMAGQRFTCASAAQSLDLRQHPAPLSVIGFEPGPWQAASFGSVDAALAAGTPVENPLAPYLALCGQTLGAVLGDANAGLGLGDGGLRGRVPSRLPALRGDTRFVVVGHGQRGGFPLEQNAWLYLMDPRARAAWLADESAWANLSEAVPAWRGAMNPQVGEGAAIVPLAYDAQQMLPCLPSSTAGADSLFESLCRVLHADAQTLGLPLSAPVEAGEISGKRQVEPIVFNDFVADLARSVLGELKSTLPERRLAVFVARLEDLGDATDADLIGQLREYFVHRRAMTLQSLQAVFGASQDAPAAWREALRALIEAHGLAVVERAAAPRFSDWPEGLTAAECATRFRKDIHGLAAALRAWPLAWAWALENRARWLDAARA